MEQYPPNHESVKDAQPTAELIQEAREALTEGYNNYSIKLGDNFEHPGVNMVNKLIGGDTLFSEKDFSELRSMRDFTHVDVTLLWCTFLRDCETLEALKSERKNLEKQLADLRKSCNDHDFFRILVIIKRFYVKMAAKLQSAQKANPPASPPVKPQRNGGKRSLRFWRRNKGSCVRDEE